jgi:hypothetical protein
MSNGDQKVSPSQEAELLARLTSYLRDNENVLERVIKARPDLLLPSLVKANQDLAPLVDAVHAQLVLDDRHAYGASRKK